jgi:hypothetical protein
VGADILSGQFGLCLWSQGVGGRASGSPWPIEDIHSSSALPDDSRDINSTLVSPWDEGVPGALIAIHSDCL